MDPYETLGVSKTAKQNDIKAAYRKLAKKLHPDLNPGNKSVEEKFKHVNKAYEMVGTEEARAKFDRGETDQQSRPRGQQQGPFQYYYETQGRPDARYSSQAGAGFEDLDPSFFEDLFGRFGGAQGGQRSRQNATPQDENYTMNVDFKTAALGGETEITLPTGKKLKVKIPGGIKSGTKLRLSKQSSLGGDAYIEVQVSPSDVFRRIGDDIEVDLPLEFDKALLGAEVRVPTLDGAVLVRIPEGISTGSKIRIKGKGIAKGPVRGDQFALVKIVMPAKIDEQLREAVKKWSDKHQSQGAGHE